MRRPYNKFSFSGVLKSGQGRLACAGTEKDTCVTVAWGSKFFSEKIGIGG